MAVSKPTFANEYIDVHFADCFQYLQGFSHVCTTSNSELSFGSRFDLCSSNLMKTVNGEENVNKKTWGICTRRAGKLYKPRSPLYRSQILQQYMRWKALAEIYTMHSFAPFSMLNFFVQASLTICQFLLPIWNLKTNWKF